MKHRYCNTLVKGDLTDTDGEVTGLRACGGYELDI